MFVSRKMRRGMLSVRIPPAILTVLRFGSIEHPLPTTRIPSAPIPWLLLGELCIDDAMARSLNMLASIPQTYASPPGWQFAPDWVGQNRLGVMSLLPTVISLLSSAIWIEEQTAIA